MRLTAILIMLSLSGCATEKQACYAGEIIYLAHEDLTCMSRGTKQQILTNNESVEKRESGK